MEVPRAGVWSSGPGGDSTQLPCQARLDVVWWEMPALPC